MTAVDRETARLVQIYEAAEAFLEQRYAEALANPRGITAAARLRALLEDVAATKAHLDASVRAVVPGAVAAAYVERAVVAGESIAVEFSFSQPHADAVKVLAQDAMGDLLKGNQRMSAAAKRTIRTAARRVVKPSPLVGETAVQAGRRLRAELQAQGIAKVRYANGRSVSVSTYASMVARTKLAVAAQTGGVAHGVASGVQFWEGADGADCGLEAHGVPPFVDGLIVSSEVAMGWPIGHPNCSRSWLPRIDVETPEDALTAESVTAPESRADQRAFEAALRDQKRAASRVRAARSAARARGRTARTPR